MIDPLVIDEKSPGQELTADETNLILDKIIELSEFFDVTNLEIPYKYDGDLLYAAEVNAIVVKINELVEASDVPSLPRLATPTSNAAVAALGQITQSWDNVTGEVSFLVKLATNSGMTTNLQTATVAADTLVKVWSGLSPDTTYYVTVTAVANGTTNLNSLPSTVASAATPAIARVATPANNALAGGLGQATQTWDNVAGEVSFEVKIATNSGMSANVQTATVAANTLTKVWTGLNPETDYYATVKAVGDGSTNIDSFVSTVASATTSAIPSTTIVDFAELLDANKRQVVLHFDTGNGLDLDDTSVPNAYDFTTTGLSGLNVVGELEAVNAVEAPVTLRDPIDLTHSANFGATDPTPPDLTLMNESHFARIQQDGLLNKATFELKSLPGAIDGFWVDVWRLVGGAFQRVGRSSNVLGQLSAGLNTVTFTGFAVQMDDRIGISFSGTTTVSNFLALESFRSNPGLAKGGMYYVSGEGMASANIYGWNHLDDVFPILAYVDASPFLVVNQDSWGEGYSYFANIQNYNGESISQTLAYQVSRILNCTVQNKGISGNTSAQTAAYFDAGVRNRNPVWVIFNMTINGDGTVPYYGTTFFDNYEEMFQKCQADGIKMAMESFGPHSAYLDFQIDPIITQMEALCATYDVIFIDTRAALGNRVGGNSWQLKNEYAADANHPNGAGNAVRAQLITDEIRKRTPVIVDGKDVKLTLNRDLVYTSDIDVSYSKHTPFIKDSVGISANNFTNEPVVNNIAPAPEALNYDPIYDWLQGSPGQWSGVRGMATVRLPANGDGWSAIKMHVGIPAVVMFTDQDDLALYVSDVGDPFYFSYCGFYYDGASFSWIKNGATYFISGSVTEGYYYRLRRDVVGSDAFFYVESSPTGTIASTWTLVHQIVTDATLEDVTGVAYIHGGLSADTPQAFGIEAYTLLPAIAAPASVTATPVSGGLNVTFPAVSGADGYTVGASPLNSVTKFFFTAGKKQLGATTTIFVPIADTSQPYYVCVYARKAGYFSSPLRISSTGYTPLA